MKHLDLFSGIGGFALATEVAFPDEEIEHVFCDNDPFSQAILKKHWPNALIYGDIKELTAERIAADTNLRESDSRNVSEPRTSSLEECSSGDRNLRIDILTGGFPCQPFSAAGRRRGTEDDRHLWPEMLRVIRETNPTYIVGENVGGLLTWDGGLVFEQVCTDLEEEGYEVQAFVIPACGLNAPHKRDRVWIVAHSDSGSDRGRARENARKSSAKGIRERNSVGELGKSDTLRLFAYTESDDGRGELRNVPCENEKKDGPKEQGKDEASESRNADRNAPHTNSSTLRKQSKPEQGSSSAAIPRRDNEDATNAESQRQRGGSSQERRAPQRKLLARECEGSPVRSETERRSWDEDWPAVAAELCTLDDGLPNGLARPRGWRNAALKGAGNAIVPQVAAEIIQRLLTTQP